MIVNVIAPYSHWPSEGIMLVIVLDINYWKFSLTRQYDQLNCVIQVDYVYLRNVWDPFSISLLQLIQLKTELLYQTGNLIQTRLLSF